MNDPSSFSGFSPSLYGISKSPYLLPSWNNSIKAAETKRKNRQKMKIATAFCVGIEPNAGVEPATLRLRVSRSTDWASRAERLRSCWRFLILKGFINSHSLEVMSGWGDWRIEFCGPLGTRVVLLSQGSSTIPASLGIRGYHHALAI